MPPPVGHNGAISGTIWHGRVEASKKIFPGLIEEPDPVVLFRMVALTQALYADAHVIVLDHGGPGDHDVLIRTLRLLRARLLNDSPPLIHTNLLDHR
jgi:hypothetical protein